MHSYLLGKYLIAVHRNNFYFLNNFEKNLRKTHTSKYYNIATNITMTRTLMNKFARKIERKQHFMSKQLATKWEKNTACKLKNKIKIQKPCGQKDKLIRKAEKFIDFLLCYNHLVVAYQKSVFSNPHVYCI